MWLRQARLRLCAVLVGLCLLGVFAPVSLTRAQGGTQPIQIGQNATGTLTAAANTAQFALTSAGGETAMIQVLAGNATNVFVDLNHPSSTTPETVAVAVDSRGEIRELSEDNNVTSLSNVSLNF